MDIGVMDAPQIPGNPAVWSQAQMMKPSLGICVVHAVVMHAYTPLIMNLVMIRIHLHVILVKCALNIILSL